MHGCITQCVTVHGRSPTMSGGMYVISRSWFNDLGGYDVGMDVWGAENLETSFRVSRRSRSRQIVHCVFAASPFCKFTDRDEPARVCQGPQFFSTENNNNNPFNGPLSRTTHLSQYQKKNIQLLPICVFSILNQLPAFPCLVVGSDSLYATACLQVLSWSTSRFYTLCFIVHTFFSPTCSRPFLKHVHTISADFAAPL